MLFNCACHTGCLHVEQCHQKGERRFRSLILIYAIGMKPVPASAGDRIVKRNLQVVLSQEPAEDTMRFLKPAFLVREPVGRGCFACKMSLERGSAMLGIDDQSEQQTGNEPGRD